MPVLSDQPAPLEQAAFADQSSDSPAWSPGPLLLLGAPGVGKGTQAKALMAAYAIPQISTGDLLRDHRARHTDLGEHADGFMRQGQLVPDDLVNCMVAERLGQPDCRKGYILDGYPRTLAQAGWLDEAIARNRSAPPVLAISLVIDHDELLRRVTGRRISPAGRIYNIYSHPPRVAGICDVDGSKLEQRSDDAEPVFEQRMRTFAEQTAPVVEHYRSQGRFAEIDGSSSIPRVTRAIEDALKRLRGGVNVGAKV